MVVGVVTLCSRDICTQATNYIHEFCKCIWTLSHRNNVLGVCQERALVQHISITWCDQGNKQKTSHYCNHEQKGCVWHIQS